MFIIAFIFLALQAGAELAQPFGVYYPDSKFAQTAIKTCWINPEADITTAGESGMKIVERVVTEQYARAGITFYGWRKCETGDGQEVVRILIEDAQPYAQFGCKINPGWCARLNFTFASWPVSGRCATANWDKAWACHCTLDAKRKGCLESYGLHEIGHVLGLAHEADHSGSTCQDRTDSHGLEELTPYDPDSVMDYCKNKKQVVSGVPSLLSAGDIETLAKIYDPATPAVLRQTFLKPLSPMIREFGD